MSYNYKLLVMIEKSYLNTKKSYLYINEGSIHVIFNLFK